MDAFLRFCGILGAVPVILTLVQRDVLTVGQGAGVLLAIVVAVSVLRTFMKVALPVFGIALFVTYNSVTNPEIKALCRSLLTLVIMLLGLFIIVRGAFGGHRREK